MARPRHIRSHVAGEAVANSLIHREATSSLEARSLNPEVLLLRILYLPALPSKNLIANSLTIGQHLGESPSNTYITSRRAND